MSAHNGNGTHVLPEFQILNYLDQIDIVKETAREYHCQCPVCGDGGFKIDKATGKYQAFKCGCSNKEIRDKIRPLKLAFEESVPRKSVRPAQTRRWEYRARDGSRLVAVKRIDRGDGTKQISQGHWTGTEYTPGCPAEIRSQIPVYRYSDVRRAIADGATQIYWVEGEPCADALWAIGIPATTSIGGCAGLTKYGSYQDDLVGVQVVVCPDMDKPGMDYAIAVAEMFAATLWCYAFPDSPWWNNLPGNSGLDMADWLAQGATAAEVLAATGPQRVKEEPVATDLDRQAAELELLIRQYANETSKTKQLLLKARILSDFRIGREGLEELASEFRESPLTFHHISEPSLEYDCDYLNVLERKSEGMIEPGIMTGYADLDNLLMGMKTQRLYFVAGRPSMGKSAFTENVVLNVASTGRTVLVFSMEMPIDEWKDRATAIHTGIDTNRIASGRIEDHEWPKVAAAIEWFSEMPIFLDQSPGITVNHMRRTVTALSQTAGEPALIVVDYLSLLRSEVSSSNRVQEVSAIARDIQMFAKESNCPVLCVSQLSRDLAGRADKRPVLTDLRESGELEQVADVVLMIHREEEYDPDSEDRGIAEILIRKNRQGAKGTVKLLYENHCVRFVNLPKH